MPKCIDSFSGQYAFLSNFYYFYKGSGRYTTVEHLYQASKTGNPTEKDKILGAYSPALAKKMGRKVDLVEGWDKSKIDVMRKLVSYKFSCDYRLRDKLLSTQDAELIEGNHWGDTFWGVCNGVGENWLGRILMEVREKVRKGEV